jgi:hypothetical protein
MHCLELLAAEIVDLPPMRTTAEGSEDLLARAKQRLRE